MSSVNKDGIKWQDLPVMPSKELYPFEFEIVILDQPVAVIRVYSTDLLTAKDAAEETFSVRPAERLLPTFTIGQQK